MIPLPRITLMKSQSWPGGRTFMVQDLVVHRGRFSMSWHLGFGSSYSFTHPSMLYESKMWERHFIDDAG
jgi:hypothetical protein